MKIMFGREHNVAEGDMIVQPSDISDYGVNLYKLRKYLGSKGSKRVWEAEYIRDRDSKYHGWTYLLWAYQLDEVDDES